MRVLVCVSVAFCPQEGYIFFEVIFVIFVGLRQRKRGLFYLLFIFFFTIYIYLILIGGVSVCDWDERDMTQFHGHGNTCCGFFKNIIKLVYHDDIITDISCILPMI